MQISFEVQPGQRRRNVFSTDQYEGVYDIHIEYLKTIRSKSLPKYHRLMADLYKAASWVTQAYILTCAYYPFQLRHAG